MTNGRNPKVDEFIEKEAKWQEEFRELRGIILSCELAEDFKWGVPCYTYDGKNIVLIHGFKEYCAILFVKGALLKDSGGILVQQTENVQASRQIRFTETQQITGLASILKAYILEAVEVEKSGLEVDFKKAAEYKVPAELQQKFDGDSALKQAFETLTPGRQRAYLLYFSEPKQAKTRLARVEKSIPLILRGKGLND